MSQLHFHHSHLDFFYQATLEMSVMSKVREFTKIFPAWKNATK